MNMPHKKDQQASKKMGQGMYTIAWILGLGLLTMFFSGHEERKINPNQNPESRLAGEQTEVVLEQNRQGHYITNGTINGQAVTFLLDTGATDVAIPEHIAERLGLKKGRTLNVSTANGDIRVYESWIEELAIAELVIKDVDANINPNDTENYILLGMSALKQVEFTQRGKFLTLKSY